MNFYIVCTLQNNSGFQTTARVTWIDWDRLAFTIIMGYFVVCDLYITWPYNVVIVSYGVIIFLNKKTFNFELKKLFDGYINWKNAYLHVFYHY